MHCLSFGFLTIIIRYTIIRRCNARNKYNTVTTMLFTDAVYGLIK